MSSKHWPSPADVFVKWSNEMSDTPDTTRPTQEQIDAARERLDTFLAGQGFYSVIGDFLVMSIGIDTLAADLARVTAENARLREALRMTDSALAEAREVLESEGYTGIVRLIDNATHERDEMERAALNGDAE